MQSTPLAIPAIGQPWPEQGGIYAGVIAGLNGAPDQHLILAKATSLVDLNWQASIDWAASIEANGHADFHLPDRRESYLLFVNLQACFEPRLHWTSEQYSRTLAWLQLFDGGYQGNFDKSYEGRARAVRRFNVQSLIHSSAEVPA